MNENIIHRWDKCAKRLVTNLIEETRKKNFMCEGKGQISDNIAKQVFHKEEAKPYYTLKNRAEIKREGGKVSYKIKILLQVVTTENFLSLISNVVLM